MRGAMVPDPSPEQQLRCPLCGEPNGCAPAESATFDTPCWCAAERLPADLLAAALRADARSCVCARCVDRWTAP